MDQPKTRARNRRGEGSKLRQDILEAAARLLDQGGEGAVTLKDIARSVGIASPSIYAHFPDREAILAAVVRQTFDELKAAGDEERARSAPDPVAQLRAACRAYLGFAERWPQRYRILFGGLWSDQSVQPQASSSDDHSRIGQDVFDVLVAVVAECQRAGQARGTDPFADAASLWAALHGLAMLRLVAPLFPWPPGLLDQMVDRLACLKPTAGESRLP